MKLEIPRLILEILNYKISRKSVQWEQGCAMRRDRQKERDDEVSSRF
jgi:hypothetical protein